MQQAGGGQLRGPGLAQAPRLACPVHGGAASLPPGGRALPTGPPARAQTGLARALPLTALPRPLPHSEKLAGTRLEVEDIALTAASQRRKLEMVLEAANRSLQVQEPQVKWSVDST